MDLSSSVLELKGIGEKKQNALRKLNIETIGDLLEHYPRTYQDRRNVKRICELINEERALVKARVVRTALAGNPRKPTLRVLVDDGTAMCEVIFFNGKWLAGSFKAGEEFVFFGKAEADHGKYKLIHPKYSKTSKEESEAILPVYPLTEGINQNELRKWMRSALRVLDDGDFLSEAIIKSENLCPYDYAIRNIHYPENRQSYREAKYRLVFDELFTIQLGLFYAKSGKECAEGIAFSNATDEESFIRSFPYEFTNAQKRAIKDIINDMEAPKVMNRLVQGDVGSGKTVVAEVALYKAAKSGYQAAMMAPTEILARQHYDELRKTFGEFGIEVGFLSGNLKAAEKRAVLADLAEGKINILVGTHAIIQESVLFRNLGLVITDEQHRFGVNQRKLLSEKGISPDMLVMTATPIPRTLAVIFYGDLDVSVIDELPPGRQVVKTKAVSEQKRISVYEFMRKEIKKGRQCYVVAPLIEDSESLDLRSAEAIYNELKDGFADIRFALLHGEMKQSEKDDIMLRFAKGEIDVLVSTVAIEVGINVPNSTLMIIENAERFGLAQLHQLRGRVGRGKEQSYCVLISGSESEISKQRAEIMCESNDGFYISEKDLELRGPGEIFGTRQHGIPDTKLADLAKHTKILAAAQNEARELLKRDPGIKEEENLKIRERILKLFGQSGILQM